MWGGHVQTPQYLLHSALTVGMEKLSGTSKNKGFSFLWQMYTSLVVSHFVDVFELNESSSAPFSLDNLFVWFFSEKIATG